MAIKIQIRDKDYTPSDPKTKIVSGVTARKAIQIFCIECMGHQPHLVKDCTDNLCPLFGYRTYETPENFDGTPRKKKKGRFQKKENSPDDDE